MTESEYTQSIYHMFSKIVGCAFASYNFFHNEVDELTYEAGIYMELEDAGFNVHRQEKFPIYYKGRPTQTTLVIYETPALPFRNAYQFLAQRSLL